MKNVPSQRHFAYRHPTFGTTKAPKSVSHWQGSVYYWWWAFLRKNVEYVACCEAGGKGPMAALYQDFGDVRDDDFKAWWSQGSRAIRLFAEPAAEDVVRELQGGEAAPDQSNVLTLVFPLNLPKRHLQKRFNQLLKKHHTGKQGIQYAKSSRARYKFEGQPNVPALKQAMRVFEYRAANPEMKLWEIGNKLLGVSTKTKLLPTDQQHEKERKKKILAATVSRYLRRAQESILRVGQGLSP